METIEKFAFFREGGVLYAFPLARFHSTGLEWIRLRNEDGSAGKRYHVLDYDGWFDPSCEGMDVIRSLSRRLCPEEGKNNYGMLYDGFNAQLEKELGIESEEEELSFG